MAPRLNAWLQHHLEGQLLLGHHWFQDKVGKKEPGIKTEPNRDWQGLYADNGSCLDITNHIHTSQNSVVQVVQVCCHSKFTTPWLFTKLCPHRFNLLFLRTVGITSEPVSTLAISRTCLSTPSARESCRCTPCSQLGSTPYATLLTARRTIDSSLCFTKYNISDPDTNQWRKDNL